MLFHYRKAIRDHKDHLYEQLDSINQYFFHHKYALKVL